MNNPKYPVESPSAPAPRRKKKRPRKVSYRAWLLEIHEKIAGHVELVARIKPTAAGRVSASRICAAKASARELSALMSRQLTEYRKFLHGEYRAVFVAQTARKSRG